MPGLGFVRLLDQGPATAIGQLSDLQIVQTAAGAVLYASSRTDGTVTVFGLAGGILSVQDRHPLPATLSPLGPLRLEVLTLDGRAHLVSLQMAGPGLPTYALDAAGRLAGHTGYLAGPNLPATAVSAAEALSLGGQDYVFTATSRGLNTYQLRPDQSLRQLGAPVQPLTGLDAELTALEAVRIGGRSFLFATSDTIDAVLGYRVWSDGRLQPVDSLGAVDGLGLATPTALEAVQVGGQTWLIVASAGSSSLSLIRVAPDGTLTPVRHLVDDLGSRFQSVVALDALVVGDRAYVAAAGADDGLSLFLLLPGGRLLQLDSIADSTGSSLQNVSAVALVQQGGQLHVLASSAAEPGLTQFSLPIGTTLRASPQGGTLEGNAGPDMIHDSAADDILRGNAGDDILFGGGAQIGSMAGPGPISSCSPAMAGPTRSAASNPGSTGSTCRAGPACAGSTSCRFPAATTAARSASGGRRCGSTASPAIPSASQRFAPPFPTASPTSRWAR